MATFWRYVKIQLMVFVFGCVGPIFLALYFATQPDPTMKWAYWFGLFITAGDVLIALALTNASDPDKTPADVRIAMALTKRRQSHAGESSSSTYDPFSSTAFSFSTDSGSSSPDYSSSDSGWSSSDSSSSDYSSSDSGSSSSDSGSSSSSD